RLKTLSHLISSTPTYNHISLLLLLVFLLLPSIFGDHRLLQPGHAAAGLTPSSLSITGRRTSTDLSQRPLDWNSTRKGQLIPRLIELAEPRGSRPRTEGRIDGGGTGKTRRSSDSLNSGIWRVMSRVTNVATFRWMELQRRDRGLESSGEHGYFWV
ncbi:hypothetical protein LINGRAHAP2_LOCUS7419, partial [Linum grandiflorum]